MANIRASRTTRVTLDQDRLIESGNTITVFGIVVANGNTTQAAIVDIQDAAGTNTITVIVPCGDSRVVDIEWVADGGLQIDSIGSAAVVVTVFHSQPGS